MEGVTGTPLCFARTDLTRSGFRVDAFLAALRRRVPMETISEDLRTYLKILQNAMIELINADYADFVNLSSNLVGLGAVLGKLDGDLGGIRDEFRASADLLGAAIADLDVHLDQKRKSRRAQNEIEDRINLLSSLSRAQNLIATSPWDSDKGEVMIERISHLLLGIRFMLAKNPSLASPKYATALKEATDHFQKILETEFVKSLGGGGGEPEASKPIKTLFTSVLLGFDSCERRDAALAIFIGTFLEPKLRDAVQSDRKRSLPQKLDSVLGVLEKQSEESEALWPSESDCLEREFLNEALLTLLLSCLDSHFSALLIPSDAAAFHAAYSSLDAFAQRWWSPGHRLLKMARGKFSLPIYFRLRTGEISGPLDAVLSAGLPAPADAAEGLRLDASARLLVALRRLWDEDVALAPLLPRLWDHTLRLIAHYRDWQDKVVAKSVGRSATKAPSAINGDTNGGDSVHVVNESERGDVEILCEVVTDLSFVDTAIFDLAFQNVWPLVRSLGGDVSSLGAALTAELGGCGSAASAALGALEAELSAELGKALASGAAEIPRQYRWTRKEAPSKPSLYIAKAVTPLKDFQNFAQSRCMNNSDIGKVTAGSLRIGLDGFVESVRGVVDSVEKISSSISRLKKAPKTTGEGGFTDDQKIRRQLDIDLKEFQSLGETLLAACDLESATVDWAPLLQLVSPPTNDSS